MKIDALSLRPFIGSLDFEVSSQFYRELGFEEFKIDHNLSVFKTGAMAFYLQRAAVKDWLENTMLFLEVQDLDTFYASLVALDLPAKYPNVRVMGIREEDWGRECFLIDPAGILWHFGHFKE